MATKVFLTSQTSDVSIDTVSLQCWPGTGNHQGGSGTGTASTAVTNTTASPPTQVTSTAGGSAVCWISPPIATAVTISGTVTQNLRGLESNAAANGAFFPKITKYSGGSETATVVAVPPATAPTEYGTTDAAPAGTVTVTPSSTAFAVGDRIVIRAYIGNGNGVTMAGSFTMTMSYDGELTADVGDTWIQFNETIVFRAGIVSTTQANTPQSPVSVNARAGSVQIPAGTGNIISGTGIDPTQP